MLQISENLEKEVNNYNHWNAQKQSVQFSQVEIVKFKERDVFFIRMGKNVGYEQDGSGEFFLRPVIVVRKFSNRIFWGVPLTTQDKKGDMYYEFDFRNRKQNAILSQIRLFDVKRFGKKIGTISKEDFQEIIKNIKGLFPDI